MSVVKPLTKEEVPEKYREYIHFDNQYLEPAPSKARPNKQRAMVTASCPVCKLVKVASINDIRNHIRGQRRSKFPIYHRPCSMPGRRITSEGYVHLYMPDHPDAYDGKYVPEHIYVMEQHLGRLIDRANESVHHINGIHDDNNITNLQLRKRFHGKGQKWQCGDCGSHNILASELDT